MSSRQTPFIIIIGKNDNGADAMMVLSGGDHDDDDGEVRAADTGASLI